LLWFVPRTTVQITKGEGESSVYRFHRMAIEHHFCPTCGCAPYGFGSMPDGTKMAAVNARCLEALDLSQLKRNQLDGKSF
jgi:hypothetical protein